MKGKGGHLVGVPCGIVLRRLVLVRKTSTRAKAAVEIEGGGVGRVQFPKSSSDARVK